MWLTISVLDEIGDTPKNVSFDTNPPLHPNERCAAKAGMQSAKPCCGFDCGAPSPPKSNLKRALTRARPPGKAGVSA